MIFVIKKKFFFECEGSRTGYEKSINYSPYFFLYKSGLLLRVFFIYFCRQLQLIVHNYEDKKVSIFLVYIQFPDNQ